MLIDASHESAAQFKALLARSEIEMVEWVNSGAGWITPFQEKKPDFLFIDYLLPKRDGLYCLDKAVKLIPGTKAVLLHAFTGLAANEIELKAFALGADAVIQRPIAENRLAVMLARLIDHLGQEKTQFRKALVLTGGQG